MIKKQPNKYCRSLLPRVDMVFVYQRMLPYHIARFEALSSAFSLEGKSCLAIEVSSSDSSYGEIDGNSPRNMRDSALSIIRLFEGEDYLALQPDQVVKAVYEALDAIKPSVVYSPAPAFSEGAAVMHYRVMNDVKWILMDDAWSATDRRSWLTRQVKKKFYKYVDGGFLPSELHGEYFSSLNIPKERQRYGVDAVPEDVYLETTIKDYYMSGPYLLFVGRMIARKGLDTVIEALSRMTDAKIKLVAVGDGPERGRWTKFADFLGVSHKIIWLGRRNNYEVRELMQDALALVVPSEFEQWGLVVNEAWQAGAPVLGSETVGALKATEHAGSEWMQLSPGDVDAWVDSITRMLSLPESERNRLIKGGKQLAELYSMENHVRSALELAELPPRKKPSSIVGLIARCWKGRVVVW